MRTARGLRATTLPGPGGTVADSSEREFHRSAWLDAADYLGPIALGLVGLWDSFAHRDLAAGAASLFFAVLFGIRARRDASRPYARVDAEGIVLPGQRFDRLRWDSIRAVYPGRFSLEMQVDHGPLVSVSLFGVRKNERAEFASVLESRVEAARAG